MLNHCRHMFFVEVGLGNTAELPHSYQLARDLRGHTCVQNSFPHGVSQTLNPQEAIFRDAQDPRNRRILPKPIGSPIVLGVEPGCMILLFLWLLILLQAPEGNTLEQGSGLSGTMEFRCQKPQFMGCRPSFHIGTLCLLKHPVPLNNPRTFEAASASLFSSRTVVDKDGRVGGLFFLPPPPPAPLPPPTPPPPAAAARDATAAATAVLLLQRPPVPLLPNEGAVERHFRLLGPSIYTEK